jgi:outer membrane protein assembly factor BamB
MPRYPFFGPSFRLFFVVLAIAHFVGALLLGPSAWAGCLSASANTGIEQVLAGSSQEVRVDFYEPCGEEIEYSVQTDVSWLAIREEDRTGILAGNTGTSLFVQFDFAGVDPGNHVGRVTFVEVGGGETLSTVEITREVVAARRIWTGAPAPGADLRESLAGELYFYALAEGNENGRLVSLAADGSERWQFSLETGEEVEAIVLGETTEILLVATGERVVAFSADTGSIVWEHAITAAESGGPALLINEPAGVAYFGGNETVAYGLLSGEEFWRVETSGADRLIGFEDLVFVASDQKVSALLGATGRQLWELSFTSDDWFLTPDGELLLLRYASSAIFSQTLNPATGEDLGTGGRFDHGRVSSAWITSGENEFISASFGTTALLRSFRYDYQLRNWSFSAPFSSSTSAGRVFPAQDENIVLLKDGLSVVNGSDGTAKKQIARGVFADGWLTRTQGMLVASPEGQLFQLEDLSETLAEDGWPSGAMRRTGNYLTDPQKHPVVRSNGLEAIPPFFAHEAPLEYVIEISGAYARAESDVPWMEIEPTASDKADWSFYRVTIDTAGFVPGVHEGSLLFVSADDEAELFTMPVALERTRELWRRTGSDDLIGLDDTGRLFLRASTGTIRALEVETGEEIWSSAESFPYHSAFAMLNLEESLLYVVADTWPGSRLVGLDLETGALVLDRTLEAEEFSFKLSPENVMVIEEEAQLTGLHPRTGAELWTVEAGADGQFSPVTIGANGRLFFTAAVSRGDGNSYEKTLRAILAESGVSLWSEVLQMDEVGYTPPPTLLIEGGRLAVVTGQSTLEIREAADGSLVETRTTGDYFILSEIARQTSDSQWITEGGRIYSGSLSASQDFAYNVRTSILLAGNQAFVGSYDDELFLFDLGSTEIKEVYAEARVSDLLLTTDGILILDSDQGLIALRTDGEVAQPSLWPMHRGNRQRTGFADALLDPGPVALDRGTLSGYAEIALGDTLAAEFKLKSANGVPLGVTLSSSTAGMVLGEETITLGGSFSTIAVSINAPDLPLGTDTAEIRITRTSDGALLRVIPVTVNRSRLLWEYTPTYARFDAPAIDADGRIVTLGLRSLVCLDDRTGSVLWEHALESTGGSQTLPVLSRDESMVFVVHSYGIHAYAMATGEVVWSQSARDLGAYSFNSPLVMSPSGMLLCRMDTNFCALDPASGTILWTSQTISNMQTAYVHEDTLIAWSGLEVRGFATATGIEQWSFSLPTDAISYPSNEIEGVSPGINGMALVSTNHGTYYALDTSSGELKHSWEGGWDYTTYGFLQTPDLHYLAVGRSLGQVTDPFGGKWDWSTRIDAEFYQDPQALLDDAGTVYLNLRSSIEAFDGASGTPRFSLEEISGNLALSESGVLVVTNLSRVAAYQTESTGLADAPWATTRGDRGNRRSYAEGEVASILLKVDAFSGAIRVTDTDRQTERSFALRFIDGETHSVRLRSDQIWISVPGQTASVGSNYREFEVALDAANLGFGNHQGLVEVLDATSEEVIGSFSVQLMVSRETLRRVIPRFKAIDYLREDIPLIDSDGFLYFFEQDETGYSLNPRLVARDASGLGNRWSIELNGRTNDSSLVLSKDEASLFHMRALIAEDEVTDLGYVLEARATTDGSLLWSQSFSRQTRVNFAMTDYGLIVVKVANQLIGVLSHNGAIAWRCSIPDETGVPMIGADGVISALAGDVLYRIDAVSGALLDTISEPEGYAWREILPLSDGSVYLTNAQGFVRKLAMPSGEVLWNSKDGFGAAEQLLLVGPEDTLLARQDETLIAIAADGGTLRWSTELDSDIRHPTWGDAGLIYVPSGPNLHALDADSGDIQWTEFFANGVCRAPTIQAGWLFLPVASTAYPQGATQLVRLRSPDPAVAAAAWPLGAGNVSRTRATLPLDSAVPQIIAAAFETDPLRLGVTSNVHTGVLRLSSNEDPQTIYLSSDQPWLTVPASASISRSTVIELEYSLDPSALAFGSHVATLSLRDASGTLLTTRSFTVRKGLETRRLELGSIFADAVGIIPVDADQLIAVRNGAISKIDLNSGTAVWQIEQSTPWSWMVDAESDRLYLAIRSSIGRIPSSVVCRRLSTGAVLWTASNADFEYLEMSLGRTFLFVDGIAHDLANGQEVFRLTPQRGIARLVRHFNDIRGFEDSSENTYHLVDVVKDRTLGRFVGGEFLPMNTWRGVVRESGRGLMIIDLRNGAILAERSEGYGGEFLATSHDRILLTQSYNDNRGIRAFDSELEVAWEYRVAEDLRIHTIFVTPAEEVVIVTDDSQLIALKLSDGSLAWEQESPRPLYRDNLGAVRLLPDGLMSLTNQQGLLVQYQLPWADQRISEWPQTDADAFRQNASWTPSRFSLGAAFEAWAGQIDAPQFDARYPEGDPDGDGYLNLFEFAMMSDPQAAEAVPFVRETSDGQLSYTVKLQASMRDRIEFRGSSDLQEWESLSPQISTQDGVDTLRFAADGSAFFLRVEFVDPEDN